MTNDRLNWRLGSIILIYLLLAVAYSVATPIGRGADEWAHYWYAQFIADNGRLPASAAEREAAGYKSDWPPLYHALTAAATGWIDTAGPPYFKYRADSLRRGLTPASGPEAIVHTEDELFPWRQEILVWHLARFLSIAFSAGTLLVTYLIALEVFRVAGTESRSDTRAQDRESSSATHLPLPAVHHSSLLALAATAVLAFNPRFIFTGMLFNYDSLTLLLSALFLLRALRAISRPSRWDFWLLGALAGLALVTKYLALLLPLVILLVASFRAGEQGRRGARAQGNKGAGKNLASYLTHYALRFTFYVLRSAKFWKHIAQAAAAYLLITGWWFAYLVATFNEAEKYGPLLGALAPLIRGDGSDRTVETLFAWLSGGQAPPPAYIEQQSYSAWQIIASFFTTFWGNPVAQPYPLNWFIAAMTLVMALALVGLAIHLRFTIYDLRIRSGESVKETEGASPNTRRPAGENARFTIRNSEFAILLLTCLLPLPFMLVRLFGARDALEAVQGRHILFLAGPAFAVLLVWGLAVVIRHSSLVIRHSSFLTRHLSQIAFYGLLALLLTGSVSQLVLMSTSYLPPAPVRTTSFPSSAFTPYTSSFTLPGGAQLTGHSLLTAPYSLQVSFFWQGGDAFAPEDYQLELALLNEAGETVSGWAGAQTQARYPTRAWEPGDSVRDDGWLPLVGLPAGNYAVQWRLLGADGPLFEWQTLGSWQVASSELRVASDKWQVWRDGQPADSLPIFAERETAQFTIHHSPFTIHHLIGPDGNLYPSASSGPGWANFIIQPRWPAGDYRLDPGGEVALRVAPSRRNFEVPAEMASPLAASFAGKIKLLGYTLPARRAKPGDGVPVTLYWQGQAWLGEEFVIFARLLDNQQVARGGYDRLARENYSTLLWAPGEIITDGFAVPVEADAPDGVYWLSVGWYRQVNGQAESLPLVNLDTGEPTGQSAVLIGPIKIGGPPQGATVPDAKPENPVNVSLGEQIELLGYDMRMGESPNQTNSTNSISSPNSSNALHFTLFWQALRQPTADYTAFVHLRDAAGSVIAQQDQPPTGGIYPTGLWAPGEIIRDEVSIPLEGVPPGEYQVVVGLYDFATSQRLPVDGTTAEIELEMVEVMQK